jgi:hypothetical protein
MASAAAVTTSATKSGATPAMSTATAKTAAAMAATSVSAASPMTSATRATATTSSAGWEDSVNSLEAAEKEYGRREHRAIQGVQRRDFLILRFGGVVSSVALRSRHHQVAVVLGLMAFINA